MSPEELAEIDHVDVLPVARVVLNASRMSELIEILKSNIASYERQLSPEPADGEGAKW